LVELLDRVLDRGAVLAADVVITVGGVPLLGLCLRAALGDVDTLVAYGVFESGDRLVHADPSPLDPPFDPPPSDRCGEGGANPRSTD
jgi:hypothetical protein